MKNQKFIWRELTNDEICKEIGDRIRSVRIKRKLTKLKLSRLTKIPIKTISKAETRGDITLKHLVQLGRSLHSDVTSGLDSMFRISRFKTLDEYLAYHESSNKS